MLYSDTEEAGHALDQNILPNEADFNSLFFFSSRKALHRLRFRSFGHIPLIQSGKKHFPSIAISAVPPQPHFYTSPPGSPHTVAAPLTPNKSITFRSTLKKRSPVTPP